MEKPKYFVRIYDKQYVLSLHAATSFEDIKNQAAKLWKSLPEPFALYIEDESRKVVFKYIDQEGGER